MKECRYCKGEVKFKDSSCIYNKSYGMIYICTSCGAYVGVHKGTSTPLGSLANKELRLYRKEAHKYFDNIWRRKKKTGDRYARSKAYKWLSNKMKLPPNKTHIGMFEIDQCKKVIELCRPYYK